IPPKGCDREGTFRVLRYGEEVFFCTVQDSPPVVDMRKVFLGRGSKFLARFLVVPHDFTSKGFNILVPISGDVPVLIFVEGIRLVFVTILQSEILWSRFICHDVPPKLKSCVTPMNTFRVCPLS